MSIKLTFSIIYLHFFLIRTETEDDRDDSTTQSNPNYYGIDDNGRKRLSKDFGKQFSVVWIFISYLIRVNCPFNLKMK